MIALGAVAVGVLREYGRAQPLGLQYFDAESRSWKPAPSPAPPSVPPPTQAAALQGWTLIEGPTIELDPTRKYAATFQLAGLERMFGSASDVMAKLREYVDWLALDVWDDPENVPDSFPTGATEQGGRFWAIGVPSTRATVERPRQIARLWSAPWKGFA